MAKLPSVVIDIKGLAGAVIQTIEAGLTMQAEHNRAITNDWLKMTEGYAALLKENPDLAGAPDGYALMAAQHADNMVAGGNYYAASDQLTDIRQLDENNIAITAQAAVPGSGIVAGFDFSALQRGEIRAANRLQFEVTVTTSAAFREEAKDRLGVQDLAQQLNVISQVLERIQAV
jgi:hypothetical protein